MFASPGPLNRYVSLSRALRSAVRAVVLATSFGAALGQVPGTPASTPLLHPTGVAIDRTNGDVYFVERGANRVRKLALSGLLQTVAGDGTQGSRGDGGPAVTAQLNSPEGLALSPTGGLYIADTGNHRIRVVSASGTITGLAGTGAPGFSGDGGLATQAELMHPTAVACDGAGTLAIADAGNHRIRVVSSKGIISTVLGNGIQGATTFGSPGTATNLNEPSGLAFDSTGNLYVADSGNRDVVLLDAAGHQARALAGIDSVALRSPSALAVDDAGALLILDTKAHRVFRWSPTTGSIAAIAGSGTQGFSGDGSDASVAAMNEPAGIAIGSNASIVLADSGNDRIRALTPAGSMFTIQTLAGQGAPSRLSLVVTAPAAISYGSGTLQASLTATSGSSPVGSLTLRDLAGPASTVIGQATITEGAATFALGGINAGSHQLIAYFPGDATYPSSTSNALTVLVEPLTLAAVPVPTAMLYGQGTPVLTGSLLGVLPRDAGSVQASFSAAANSASPPGAYPIQVALTGPAAANYTPQANGAVLTVSQAPTTVSIAASGAGVNGVLARVSSTTSGVPSGSVVLYAGATVSGSALISSGGVALVDTSRLTSGTHHLQAVYSGDGNFLGSTSGSFDWTASSTSPAQTTSADFTFSLAKNSSEVDVLAGDTAAVSLVMSTVHGQLSGPVALSVTGLPSYATGNFDPPVLPPGSASVPFTLHIATSAVATNRHKIVVLLPIVAALLPVGCFRSRRRFRRWCAVFACATAVALLGGCGDRVGSSANAPTASVTRYNVVVTGTATGSDGQLLQHSVNLTLKVQR